MTAATVTPTTLVGAVLALLKDKHPKASLPTEKSHLHSIFFDIRHKCPGTLDFLEFDTRDMYPYSPSLDEAFANLQAGGALGKENPYLTAYSIKVDAKAYRRRLDPDQMKRLGAIAEELASRL